MNKYITFSDWRNPVFFISILTPSISKNRFTYDLKNIEISTK